MKLQNLALIFLIIAIPIIVLMSYYLYMQEETIRLRIKNDENSLLAIKDSIKAFEANSKISGEFINNDVQERDVISASINTFFNSFSNNLNKTGMLKEAVANYVPAVVATMYDGYYMFSTESVPVTINGANGNRIIS